MSGLELGGLVGSLLAGRLSDWYISRSPDGAVGKRIRIVIFYLVGVSTSLIAFRAVPCGRKFMVLYALASSRQFFQDWQRVKRS